MRYSDTEIRDEERRIGHLIPRPCSQTLLEDLEVMSESRKRQGEGLRLLAMARQIRGKEES